MNFQFSTEQSPAENVHRILTEEVEFIQENMQAIGEERHKAVHNSRKSFKRIRALLRLIRGEIGESIYRKENIFYRDASRLLAAVRDSYVQLKTFNKVTETAQLSPEWAQTVRDWLQAEHDAISTQKLDDEQVLLQVSNLMTNGRSRIQYLPIRHKTFTVFDSGLAIIYQQGQKQMHDAYDRPSVERFHSWRKRVKYLWHHMELLQAFQPALCTTLAEDLHNISDHLGDAHDFAVIRETLESKGSHLLSHDDAIQFINHLRTQQHKLEQAIRPLAEQVYAQKPNDFTQQFNLH